MSTGDDSRFGGAEGDGTPALIDGAPTILTATPGQALVVPHDAFLLAHAHGYGRGRPVDPTEAQRLLEAAAAQGSLAARVVLRNRKAG